MTNNTFMKVEEVAEVLGVSKSYAYKIVQQLNNELKKKGFLTISGRVNKQYFMEKTCYSADSKEKE
ncbi:MAG: DNA-binding protein [Eubacterium sp.]|nr:DNA-binding protein [Eubacterium sp.]